MTDLPSDAPEPIDLTALNALAQALLDPAFRTAFKQDPAAAMAGRDINDLPDELIDHLAALTDQELAFLAGEAQFLSQFPVTICWL